MRVRKILTVTVYSCHRISLPLVFLLSILLFLLSTPPVSVRAAMRPLEWSVVKARLESLSRESNENDVMRAVQLHAEPDVWVVHGFLHSDGVQELLALHNATQKGLVAMPAEQQSSLRQKTILSIR